MTGAVALPKFQHSLCSKRKKEGESWGGGGGGEKIRSGLVSTFTVYKFIKLSNWLT